LNSQHLFKIINFKEGSENPNGEKTLPFKYLLAVGLESGTISLWSAVEHFNTDTKKTTLKWNLFLQIEALYP
jgi:hypothetical protein